MASQTQLLLSCLAVAVTALAVLIGSASSESGSAVFKLHRDACLPESDSVPRFLGQPTRLSCIVECVKSNRNFNAIQMLPGMQSGSFDCECVEVTSSSTPCCRINCERWDVSSSDRGSSDGGSSNDSGWNATTCPGITNPWKPVVSVNKCIYRKNDASINMSLLNSSPCGTNGQLFDVQDPETESQLVKYVNYLSNIGNPISEFWAQDSRNTSNKCAFKVVSNSLVKLSPCDAEGSVYRQLYPICENTICFPGASPGDFRIIELGSSGVLWYYFNETQVANNESCKGNKMASIESGHSFEHIKNGIVKRGWLGKPVWIANSGGFLPAELLGPTSCVALTINSSTSNVSTAASAEECDSEYQQVCQYEFNNGESHGSSQSPGFVTNNCWLSTSPPANAQKIRTVGNLCYYYTGNTFNLASTTDPNAVCSAQYKPALIDADYIKAKDYVLNIKNSVEPEWEAWLWTANSMESLTSTNGDPITITVDGSGSYYINRTGSPFKGDSNGSRPVICRSDAEVCPSSSNYLNFASSTNSCVALQMDSVSRVDSETNCAELGGGSLLELQSEEEFSQIRDIIIINGRENQLFWVNNGTVGASNCSALQVASPTSDWALSVVEKSCTDLHHYICEKPFVG